MEAMPLLVLSKAGEMVRGTPITVIQGGGQPFVHVANSLLTLGPDQRKVLDLNQMPEKLKNAYRKQTEGKGFGLDPALTGPKPPEAFIHRGAVPTGPKLQRQGGHVGQTQHGKGQYNEPRGFNSAARSQYGEKAATLRGKIAFVQETIEFRFPHTQKDQFAGQFAGMRRDTIALTNVAAHAMDSDSFTAKGNDYKQLKSSKGDRLWLTLGKHEATEKKALLSADSMGEMLEGGMVSSAATTADGVGMLIAALGGSAMAGPVAAGATIVIVAGIITVAAVQAHLENLKAKTVFLRVTSNSEMTDKSFFEYEEKEYATAAYGNTIGFSEISDFIERNIHSV
ncbi:MAG: hypothetical protein DHS20C21_10880 [Gemmatimonadota bacterium]|nr:MAG: hypothetical protein DHS20C21_10880 [Gemmatimonadota bacterium]